MKLKTLLITVLAFACGSAHASPYRGPRGEPKPVKLGPVERGIFGGVKWMYEDRAEKFCSDKGLRLPTILELARVYYPTGLSEQPREGARLISPNDSPAFYFSNSPEPLRDEMDGDRYLIYWSSSRHEHLGRYIFSGGYISYNDDRFFFSALAEYAVRCVVDEQNEAP